MQSVFVSLINLCINFYAHNKAKMRFSNKTYENIDKSTNANQNLHKGDEIINQENDKGQMT